ncbi:MAG: hypothetical protein IJE07_10470 [Clostridia bacterium]|nr:hypothetical protein [Clostridia bacterium]
MKRIFSLFLALLLLLSALPSLAEQSGPVLIPAELPGLPEGYYAPLGNGRALVIDHKSPCYAICDLESGELTPLHTLEEDTEAWMAAISTAYAAEGESISVEELMLWYHLQGEADMLSTVLPFMGMTLRVAGTHYATFREGFVLNVETGLLRPTAPSVDAQYTTCVGEHFIGYSIHDGVISLGQYTADGALLQTATVTLDAGYALASPHATPDGVLFTLLSGEIDEMYRKVAFLFVDGGLVASPMVELGQWSNNNLSVNYALYSAASGKLLIQADGTALGKNVMTRDAETGRVTVSREPYGPWLDGLMLVDVATGEVQRIGEEMFMPVPLGLSADGSYALIYDHNGSLHRLDMATGALTQTMSVDDVAALFNPVLSEGYRFVGSLGNFVTFPWDGGDYAVYNYGIFRVQ